MTDKQKKTERIIKFMSFINNYCGELRITKNKIYDGSRLVAVYRNNEITLIGDDY